MSHVKNFFKSLNPFEYVLWIGSVLTVLVSFFAFGGKDYLNLTASVLGASMLIFVAKGNPFGQILSIVFSVFYGCVSYSIRYYGEMITYLGMTAPIAVAALVSWLRNPFDGNRLQVRVGDVSYHEFGFLALLATVVTLLFGALLFALNTANLLWSTVSVFTSFVAAYLTVRRSPFYALGYAANDLVLIVLWALAAQGNREYIALVICFSVFFLNDLYGFYNWLKLRKKQRATEQGMFHRE